ncbi:MULTISPECIES: GntR family transcriptional regulator [Streptomyces]|uniref:GntR family transcriptional regulator n=2 Tax=Streptomyces TaxID=1883 RepID=A0A3R7EVZ8_9ACTN|nr:MULTISPECIES: GntR family transcriptional regulator [Streptomyces]KNE83497.1 GntR family transcriptional regulator [Streptomyces fradiae]OFA61983.1 GntR family transcriptional regulator [Streptomyces fradiae]PQM24308.1 GntR family transcriptional regulator [Streptomyces xinghaiensis]RKM97276.1 GntR family transcriptional regulator [Streptomyces xinghaiensis]RNC75328.1 GntR family transcriptional regulator [Streptomyces xinghaiensis]
MPPEKAQAKYRQIAEHLRRSILDGTYPAGQPLPSEEVLAKQFGVTRPTVRQGIAELRAAGLVEVMMGRGMFVRSPHSRPSLTRPRGLRREPDGHYVEADGLRWENAEEPVATRTDAPLALADLLRVPPGEPLYTYDALQTADRGRLRQLHRTYVPFSVLLGTKYEEQAPPPAPHLYAALAELGHELHFTEYVRTRMPLPDQAQALRLPDGVPLLQILRVALNAGDKPLALEEFHVPGDDLELSYAL